MSLSFLLELLLHFVAGFYLPISIILMVEVTDQFSFFFLKKKELLILLMFLSQLEPLAYRRMDFEEFCAAAISPYQLEALERWEEIAGTAFQHFEQEGNRVISVEELAQVFSTCAYALG